MEKTEGHADSGSLGFAKVENQHAALLIETDDPSLLEVAGADVGEGFLAESVKGVKLSHRCFHPKSCFRIGNDGLTQIVLDG